MALVTKTDWTTSLNAIITTNGVRAITGALHNSLWTDQKDSVVWRTDAAGTLIDQTPHLAFSGTMPTVITGITTGILFDYTSNGSSSQQNGSIRVNYGVGYTGSFLTFAGRFNNGAAGTGATLIPAAGSNSNLGNAGITSDANATTTGYNFGVRGTASNGDVSVGVIGLSQIAKNSATNIGVVGSAINTGSSGIEVGGWFSLNQETVPTESAALIVDNDSQTAPIALFKDNGTAVFTIADGGVVTATQYIVVGNARMISQNTNSLFIGPTAGNLTTTGINNTLIGSQAGKALTTGDANTIVGVAGVSITDGGDNTLMGSGVAVSLVGGSSNTAIGAGSLAAVSTGNDNTVLGADAGDNISTGSNNIVIGRSSDAASATASNQLNIQNIIWGTGNSETGTTVSTGLIGIGISGPTAKLHLAAGTTAAAQLRFAAGVAPSSPNDGDMYYIDTNDRLMFRKAADVEILAASAVSSVAATLPNRTLTIVFNGTTYYLHAKTTND